MLKLITLSAILTLLSPLYSQEITMVYEPEDSLKQIVVRDLIETSDDHLFAGYDIVGSGATRSGIMKMDLNGEVIWSKKMNLTGASADCVYDVAENSDGNFYLLGYGKGGGLFNFAFLVEINPDGEILWSKIYDIGAIGGIPFYRINQLNVLPSGDLHMMISSHEMIINLRTNAGGEILWAKKLIQGEDVGTGKNPGFEWITTPDGGGFCASKSDDNLLLLHYAPDGELLWHKHYQLGNYTHGKSIVLAPNGNLLISGYIQVSGTGALTPHIIELDFEDGSIEWVKTFDGLISDFASRSHLTVYDGRIYLDFTIEDEIAQQYIIELSENGEVLKTMKSNKLVSDYNRLKFSNVGGAYFFGSIAVDEAFYGVINRTENVFTESCLIEPTEALHTSDYEDYSEITLDIEETNHTAVEDAAISVENFNLRTSDDCAASLTIQPNESKKWTLYPNPTVNNFTLSITDNLLQSSFYIVDLSGRVMFAGTLNEMIQDIDVSSLEPGQYILSIQSENQVTSEQFTVIK